MHALWLSAAAWCGRAGVGSSDAGLTWWSAMAMCVSVSVGVGVGEVEVRPVSVDLCGTVCPFDCNLNKKGSLYFRITVDGVPHILLKYITT